MSGATPQATPIDPADRAAAEGFSALWRIGTQLVAAAGAVLALLVYFGWVSTGVFYDVFGINASTLGFSAQDYALRSVDVTVPPLTVVLLAFLLVRPAHALVLRAVRSRRRAAAFVAPAVIALGGLSVALGLIGFTGLARFDVEWPLVPMSLGLGALVVAYGVTVRRMPSPRDPVDPTAARPAFASLQRVALAAVVVLTTFWSAAVFAQLAGIESAERIANRPATLPGVVVFTPHRLYLVGSGVRETALPAEAEPKYRYRYDGLRVLIRSDGRFFLLPAGWRPGTRAVVLSEEADYRMEFFRD